MPRDVLISSIPVPEASENTLYLRSDDSVTLLVLSERRIGGGSIWTTSSKGINRSKIETVGEFNSRAPFRCKMR